MLSAAILIGGRSRRMGGRFKPLLDLGGRSILMRQFDALRRAAVEHIALVGRWSVEEPPPAPVFADAIEGAGSLGGIYTALLIGQGHGLIVLAGDMPLVDASLVAELIRHSPRAGAVLPIAGNRPQPLCAWYARSLATAFKARIDRGELRILDAIAEVEHLTTFATADTMLMNVNTVADYERAREAARRRT